MVYLDPVERLSPSSTLELFVSAPALSTLRRLLLLHTELLAFAAETD